MVLWFCRFLWFYGFVDFYGFVGFVVFMVLLVLFTNLSSGNSLGFDEVVLHVSL